MVGAGTRVPLRSSRPRLKNGFIFRVRRLVLICWELGGCRGEVRVPLREARWRRQQLEESGAVIYWSQRLAG